jgi:hypothetical protein
MISYISINDLKELASQKLCDWSCRKVGEVNVLVTEISELDSCVVNCVSPIDSVFYQFHLPQALREKSVQAGQHILNTTSTKQIRSIFKKSLSASFIPLMGNLFTVHGREFYKRDSNFYVDLSKMALRFESYFFNRKDFAEIVTFFERQIQLLESTAVISCPEYLSFEYKINSDGASYLGKHMAFITDDEWKKFESDVESDVEVQPIRYLKPVCAFFDPTQDFCDERHLKLFNHRMDIFERLCPRPVAAYVRDVQAKPDPVLTEELRFYFKKVKQRFDYRYYGQSFDGKETVLSIMQQKLSSPLFLDWLL